VFQSFQLHPVLPVIRIVVRAHIIFIHNLLVFLPVALLCKLPFDIRQLLLAPVLPLFVVNGICAGMILAIVCSRFRDIQPLINALIGVLFLVTPIIWRPEMLGDRKVIATMNPFTHYIAVIREPLLGNCPDTISLIVVASTSCFVIGLTIAAHRWSRNKLIFWM
jgi:ABC-type polysaccharide/polyol phosphate export permease